MGKEEFVQAVLGLHLATQVTHKPSPPGTAGLGESDIHNLGPGEIIGTECVQFLVAWRAEQHAMYKHALE